MRWIGGLTNIGVKRKEKKYRGTTIGVMGVGNGVGSTTIAIALAHYLQTKGYKIAILEMGKRVAFERIESYVRESSNEEGMFQYKGVDYYKRVKEENLYKIIPMNYDYYLFDLGNGRNAIKEIIRSDLRLAVMLHSEWRHTDILEFHQTYKNEDWFHTIYIINNLYCKYTLNKIFKSNKIYNIPLIWDKYKVGPEIRNVFREIVKLN